MTKRSQVTWPFSLPQFCWQMDGKPQVPSGSSRGQRWDLGRGVAPKASVLESHWAGLCGCPLPLPSPPPRYWRKAPRPPSETGQTAVRPRSAEPGPIPVAGGSCAPLLIFTRLFCSELRYHCLLLIGARRWREGSEQASFCPFGWVGWVKRMKEQKPRSEVLNSKWVPSKQRGRWKVAVKRQRSLSAFPEKLFLFSIILTPFRRFFRVLFFPF